MAKSARCISGFDQDSEMVMPAMLNVYPELPQQPQQQQRGYALQGGHALVDDRMAPVAPGPLVEGGECQAESNDCKRECKQADESSEAVTARYVLEKDRPKVLYKMGFSRHTACAECHRLRVRCDFVKGAKACTRCLRKKERCVPRLQMKKGETADELRKEAAKWLRALWTETGEAGEHFNAVRMFVKSYKALGFKEPPPSLLCMCVNLFLIAREQRSVRRLHSATCMAAALGIDKPMLWLEEPPAPVTEEQLNDISVFVHENALFEPLQGASLIVRCNVGKRELLVNRTFEFFFRGREEILSRMALGGAPIVEEWAEFVDDSDEVEDFFSGVVWKKIVGSPVPQIYSNQYVCIHESEEPVRMHDCTGARFTATLVAVGSYGFDGICYTSGVGMRGLAPADEAGHRRWHEFQMSLWESETDSLHENRIDEPYPAASPMERATVPYPHQQDMQHQEACVQAASATSSPAPVFTPSAADVYARNTESPYAEAPLCLPLPARPTSPLSQWLMLEEPTTTM